MVFRRFFQVFLRRYLSMKSLLLCLVLLPMLVAIATVMVEQPQTATSVVVGLVVEGDGLLEQQVAATLLERSDVTFLQYSNQTAMEGDVAKGVVAAGYVLGKNFSQQVASLDEENLVSLICLEGDVYHQYLNELVYTAVYAQMVPYITQEFLSQRGIEIQLEEAVAGTEWYLEGDVLFSVDVVSAHQSGAEEEHPSPLPWVRGLLAMGLLLLALMGAASVASQQRGWALFAPHLGQFRCEVYSVAPIYVLGLVSGVVALVLATLLSSYPIALGEEIVRLALYQLSLVVVGLGLPRLVGRDSIVLLIPFLLLFLLVTHPILLDVTVFFPQLKVGLQWLPSYWYVGG